MKLVLLIIDDVFRVFRHERNITVYEKCKFMNITKKKETTNNKIISFKH